MFFFLVRKCCFYCFNCFCHLINSHTFKTHVYVVLAIHLLCISYNHMVNSYQRFILLHFLNYINYNLEKHHSYRAVNPSKYIRVCLNIRLHLLCKSVVTIILTSVSADLQCCCLVSTA